MQLADTWNGEQRGKWTAEQIFTHREEQKVGGERGRFASSASDGANHRLGSEKEVGEGLRKVIEAAIRVLAHLGGSSSCSERGSEYVYALRKY